MQILPVNLPAIRGAIAAASARSGVDFGFLLQTAEIESGLNPAARAGTSSASGLFQFVESTWLEVIRKHGAAAGVGWAAEAMRGQADPAMRAAVLALRDVPEVAAGLAGALTAENAARLFAGTGRRPGSPELYLAHFLGVGGAVRFINALAHNPDQVAGNLFPAAAASNKGLFKDRSVAELYQHIANLFENGIAEPTRVRSAPVSASAKLAYLTLAALGG